MTASETRIAWHAGEMPQRDVLVVTDDNVRRAVVEPRGLFAGCPMFSLAPGDANKTLAQAERLWLWLTEQGATRRTTLVNFGGGMVTDLGGFAAATFKRGLPFVNVPTTLLGAVDAAVGGKTGVNLAGLKNQVGVFAPAALVVVSADWFATLPRRELLSGWGEMLKHALIDDGADGLLAATLREFGTVPSDGLLRRSVLTKERIVAADPREQGLRKALNAGHTIGHAVEELALEKGRPVPHGYAVAWGLVAEGALAALTQQFPSGLLHDIAAVVKEHYGAMPVTCDDYPRLLELMRHDKKNADPSAVNFTLLGAPGDVRLDCTASADTVRAALDIARDLTD